MPLPSTETIETLFQRDPALFIFRRADDDNPPRSVGGRDGAAIQIDGPYAAPERVVLAVILPNDDEAMARRGGVLLVLLLTLIATNWSEASDWVTTQLRTAAYDARLVQTSERVRGGLRYELTTDKQRSLATLVIGGV